MRGRWNSPVAALIVVCCTGLLAPAQTDPARQIRERLLAARSAVQAGDVEAARREYRTILAIDPNQLDAHGSLGLLAFFAQDFPTAAKHFSEVVRLQPTSWDARAFLGMSLRRIGKVPESLEALKSAFANLSDDAELKSQVGMELVDMHFQSGELEQAAAVVDQVANIRPDSLDVLYASHHVHSRLADRALQSMIAVGPESARLYQVIAQHRADAGDVKGAIEYFGKALALNAQLPGVRFEYGQALLLDIASLESLESARDQFQVVLQSNPEDSAAERQLAEAQLLLGNDTAAAEHFDRALLLNPRDAAAHFGLGKLLAASDNAADAASHLQEAIRLNPDHVLAHYRLASVYQRLGRTEEADREAARFEKLRAAERDRDRLKRLLGRSVATSP